MIERDEVERRYANARAALAEHGLDALVVCGSEYTGFEGAVTYLSGFQIVHRYAYVLLPADGDPAIVFPAEARYVGEHGTTWIEEQIFAEHPGAWLADRLRGRRVGVYGLDFVMAVRDYRALSDAADLVAFDVEFDLARAVKSDRELESVRESARINEEGFRIFLDAFEPGKSEAELLAPCEKYFVEQGCGRLTMDMVLVGEDGAATPEFRIASAERRVAPGDLVLPSLEIAGPGGHWVEISRAISAGPPSDEAKRMLDAYEEYVDAARETMRPGATAHDVHRAVSRGFAERGYRLGHVTGHSIGMTMIEHPKIGEGVETELRENMVFSMHPHAITPDGAGCLYMQDTWLVTNGGGRPLADLPMRIFDRTERVRL
ncbi:MAG: Xaa-Pro peptidase family protein [Actinomycetota bacterium]|nr:Xaa-Pro peptidase family protein [Actinomycetota bacterium]